MCWKIMDDMFAWGHQCYFCGYSLLSSGVHCAQQEIFCMTEGLLKIQTCISNPPPVLTIPHCSSKIPVSTSYSPFLLILWGLHLDWDLFKAKALKADCFFNTDQSLKAFFVTSTVNTIESTISFAISRTDVTFLGTIWYCFYPNN